MTARRPNILMIMADQLPARTLGAYGHPIVKTPHLDALARRCVTFNSAYANCPICAPSRASMCTGQLVSRVRAYDNGADFPSSTPTFMHHLRRAGYETLLAGKMHFLGPDQLHGFERRLTPEIYPSGFNWTADWTKGAHANPGTAVDQLREAGVCGWSMQMDYDEEVAFRSLEALRDLARRREDGRPFFLCSSFTHPHDPFLITRKWWDLYDHATIDMPAVPGLPLQQMHPYNQWLQIHHMIDQYPPREADVRNARHAFYGMVSYFDDLVGRLTAELERLGLADDTIIVVTSDHGEMLGEHGMWFKRTFYEDSVHVPLIIGAPGRFKAGHRVDDTVSLVDLFPTFLEAAGVEHDAANLDGRSLVPALRGERCNSAGAIVEYFSEGVCQPMRVAVKDAMKYVYVHREAEQLFDLARDPMEMTNVIADPAYANRLAALRRVARDNFDFDAAVADVLASQRDRRLVREALAQGRPQPWDVQPHFDAARQYVRDRNAQATNRDQRYPRVD